MYRSPRLVDVPVVVELPTTMYKAPVLNGLGGVELGASCYRGHGPCKSYPEATALEARQEAVLARLQTLKEKLDHLQSTRTTATGAAPPTLGAAAISSPNKEGEGGGCRGEGDLLRHQESVLYRLGKLKEKLSQLSNDGNSGTPLVEGQKITLAEKHQGLLGIIGALRDEMKFLANLQKQMEQEEHEKEEKKQKNKEKEMKKSRIGEQKEEKGMQEDQEEEDIEKHQRSILRKINTLKDELLRMVAGLRSVVEAAKTEEERAMLTSVCRCFDLQNLDLDLNSQPPPPPPSSSLDSSLHPSQSSSFTSSFSPLPSSTSSTILPLSSSVSAVPSVHSLSSSTIPPPSSSPSTSSNKTDSLLSLLPSPPPPSLLSSSSASSSPLQTEYGTVHDLVVAASPAAPPLSLLLLRRLLAQAGRPVHCTSRLHSSVTKVDPKLHAAFTAAPLGDRGNHSLAFSLQWTDTPTPSLMVNPLRQMRIEGEANLIRYISRLFPSTSSLNYEAVGSYSTIAEVDTLLDSLEARLSNGSGKGRGGRGGSGRDGGVMKEIVERLSKQPYLLGNTCSMVDILTWSLLRQGGGGGGGGEVVRQWTEKMDRLAAAADLDLNGIISGAPASQQQEKQKQTKQQSAPSSSSASGGYKGRKELEAYLKKLGIKYQCKEHKEVFTVEELMKEMQGVEGVVTKNLFVRDKKKKLYLLSACHDKEVDLKTVAKQAGTKDLRFSDEDTLFSALGVKQGCVSGLALLNDSSSHSVTFLLDRSAIDPTVPLIHFHPMSNSATLGLKPGDFVEKFLSSTGHKPVLIDL
ncbi:uncharacterized protein LOC126997916 isoform X2 [Eriocheir sinensis]|uniref:uncharacterized protein LOC126997916 isoform X2 n=1 Tax=Eriocheir sinensis TaxID=95602 RepID=UPI0021C90B48|nr:uncharacterized protein LOC126997916 isoform X2 [Eriocheir sinensis]